MIRKPKAKATAIATLGVDIGKNTFHLVGLDKRGAIVLDGLRQPPREGRGSGRHPIGHVEDYGPEALSCTRYTAFRYRPGGDYPLVEMVGMPGSTELAF